MPYWQCEILPSLAWYDQVLVVAHGNSLRGIVKHLKGISDEAISEFNLPTATPYVFEFGEGLNCVKDYFLGDPDEIARLMQAVPPRAGFSGAGLFRVFRNGAVLPDGMRRVRPRRL